jgi:predicted GTPase
MKEVTLKYNPFEAKASCQYKGKDDLPKCMGNGEYSRLQDWLYDFFPQIIEKHNWGDGDECKVSFYGTPGDFEDLEHARDVFNKDHPGIQICLEHINKESKTMTTRLSDLKAIFEKMQNESPYEELKNPTLKSRFDSALSSEFEISVIATMSSGKSTLINAMLGQELLPARNEATTAKIAQIYDISDAKGWTVKGLKKGEDDTYSVVEAEKPATLVEIEKLNSSNNIDKIEIRGNIPGINPREMQLVLSDTPGPNNSRTIDHAKHIDNLIKDDYKPMIMYIFNATQLEITDDKSLLEKIAKAMEGNSKQGADRFLFVLNKADELDPDKGEFVEKKVDDSHKYLERQFKIKGARIFPVSAQLARVIRMNKAGCKLTENEEDFLNAKRERFINRKERHFSDYVSLSPSCKTKQEEMLQNAIAENDRNTQALVYSGLPAIELAVDEYLEKYAFTAKISKAVGVFKGIIDRLDLKNKTEEELAHNKEERKKVASELKTLRGQIESGAEAKKLKEKFDEDIVSIKKKLDKNFKGHETDIRKALTEESEKYVSDDVSKTKAKEIIDATRTNMELKYSILSSDIISLFETELKNQAQSYIEEYQRYISDLVKTEGFAFNATINLIQVSMPDNVDDLLEKFTGTKIVTKTVRRSAGNPDKAWYKPWTWFDDHYHTWNETEETEKSIIKMKEIFEKSIEPNFQKFFSMIDNARTVAEENAEGLKNFFTKEIKRLDKAVQETIQKEEESIKSQEAIDQKIKENKDKAEWLKEFIKELDRVLEV